MSSADIDLPLVGKTALVTGSARGIGAAIAWKLATEGADIVIHHLSETSDAQAEELASRIRSLPNAPSVLKTRVNIAKPAGPSEIVQELRAWRAPASLVLDILINNAGIAPPAMLSDISAGHFCSVIATNLQGPLLMIQAVSPYLSTRQHFRGLTVYAASKAELEAVTRHLAHELSGDGTTVNCVTPGAVESELLRETDKKIFGIIDSICANTPLQRRVGTAEEFAAVVAWWCKPEADWMTGQTISASGGQAMY